MPDAHNSQSAHPLSPGEAWRTGQVLLDDFEVKREVGRGGMGAVYLVQSRSTEMQFAVKRALIDDENTRRGFLSELQMWIDLPECPHIAACRFFRTFEREIVIFAEYVGGGTLAAWIRNGRLAALSAKLDAAIQFAWGLHAIHEHGLIHQDVKPGNALLTEDGIVKVADFGLARARSRSGGERTAGRGAAGDDGWLLVSSGGLTPAYCSPEQATGAQLSRATDIWSWGLSVLEMFAGQPFWARTADQAPGRLALDALEQYIVHRSTNPALTEIPKAVADVLRKCFQREPRNRWATVSEAAQALARAHRELVGTPYTRTLPPAAARAQQQNAPPDRRAVSGVQWTDPREWLATVLQLERADLSDPQLRAVPAARTRKAQAIEDLAIYDNVQRRLERLIASGRIDLEMQLSMVHMDKALVHKTAGDPQGAYSMYERAAAIREKLALHGTSENADSLALVYQNHASLLFDLGDNEKSLELCDCAIEIRKRLVVEEQQESFADGLAVLYMNKGVALAALGRREYAVSTYDEAIEVMSRLINEHGRRDLDRDLARAYQNKAMSLKALMRFVEAFRCYDHAIAIFERLIQDGRREVRVDLAGACMNKASLFLDLDRQQENIEISRRAMSLMEELVTTEGHAELSHLLARATQKMANALLLAENYKAGLALSDRAVELWKRVVNLDGRQEFLSECQQAERARDTNRETLANRTPVPARDVHDSLSGAAERPSAVVIQLQGKAGVETIPMEFNPLLNRAHELASEGRFAVADQLCQQAYVLRPDDTALLALASACALKIEDIERASPLLNKLVRLAPGDRDAWLNLALCLLQQNLRKQQIFALQKVIEINAQDGPAHALLADALFFEEQFDEAMLTLAKLKDIPGWEIRAVCKSVFILGHRGRGMIAYMILKKTIEKHQRSASLWFMMARVLSTFPEHRQNALNAAYNAASCLSDDPRQLQPEERQELNEMLRGLAS